MTSLKQEGKYQICIILYNKTFYLWYAVHIGEDRNDLARPAERLMVGGGVHTVLGQGGGN